MKSKFVVVDKESNLLNILENNLKDLSRKKIKSFIKYKMVLVDGKVVTNSSQIIKKGSSVEIFFSKKIIPEVSLDIIYEDKDLIVINKPAGLLSISNQREKEITAFRLVSDYVKKNNKNAKIFVVHRLDQGTSGVLMFSKNLKLKEDLQNAWNDLVRKREYIAVVEGQMKGAGTIESYLSMNKAQVVYSTKGNFGWYAVTHYKVLKSNTLGSLLEVNIDTGRRNQIRVHMSEKGHPIFGDKKYGSKNNPIGRLALHASKLWIIDPRSDTLLKLEAEVPKELKNIVK